MKISEQQTASEVLNGAICSGLSPAQERAIRDASEILRTEANELARYMERNLRATLAARTQEVVGTDAGVPHRVVIALRNEMERLRSISQELIGMLPATGADAEDQ